MKRISSLQERILSFKRNPILKRDTIDENLCLFKWSPFGMLYAYQTETTEISRESFEMLSLGSIAILAYDPAYNDSQACLYVQTT